jgi:serine/threonine protein kinase
MAFLDKIIKKLPFISNDGTNSNFLSPFNSALHGGNKKKKANSSLIIDRDPAATWEIVSELGDGAFGKVYKARNRQTGVLAAAKIVEKCTSDELDDYTIEIDILSECKHKNIVQLHEAYYYDSKLWVKLTSHEEILPNQHSNFVMFIDAHRILLRRRSGHVDVRFGQIAE